MLLFETADGRWRIHVSKRPGFDLVEVGAGRRLVTWLEGAALVEIGSFLAERGVASEHLRRAA